MTVIEILTLLFPFSALVIGYIFWDLKQLKLKMYKAVTAKDVRLLINDKLASVGVEQKMIEKRLDRLEAKLDMILAALTKRK